MHVCDAIVISCIDFRFQKHIRKWIDKNLSDKTFDYVGYAGSTKELSLMLNQIAISVRLHKIDEVILMHHENCGAYGKESTREKHGEDLLRAEKTIHAHFPHLKVKLYYVYLNGDFEQIVEKKGSATTSHLYKHAN